MASMGFLNNPVQDPLTMRPGRRTTTGTAALLRKNNPQPPMPQQPQQPIRRGGPAQTHAQLPPMYAQALPPPQQLTSPSPAATATNAKLEMWRQKRAEKLAQQKGHDPEEPLAPMPKPLPIAPSPPAPVSSSATLPPPVPLAIPTATSSDVSLLQFNALRQELTNLVSAAPKVDIEQRLVPMNHRLQDFDVRLNTAKNQVEQILTSLKCIQQQAGADRRMLLNNISPEDFKNLHGDLAEALTLWLAQAEDHINEALQEFSDRCFMIYADVVIPCPLLTQASFLAPNGVLLPVGTRLRICYPQIQTSEGVFARSLSVNVVGEIDLAWIPLHNATEDIRYINNFTI